MERADHFDRDVDETASFEALIKDSCTMLLGEDGGKATATTDTNTKPSEKGSVRRGADAQEIVLLSRNTADSNEFTKETVEEFAAEFERVKTQAALQTRVSVSSGIGSMR